jgi:biotin transporter BioY
MNTTEMFTAVASNLPETAAKLGGSILLTVVLILIYMLIYSIGAAKLAYAYNNSVGSSYTFLWAVLAFFFSNFYYPFYAFFINPVGAPPPSMLPAQMTMSSVGGRRKK